MFYALYKSSCNAIHTSLLTDLATLYMYLGVTRGVILQNIKPNNPVPKIEMPDTGWYWGGASGSMLESVHAALLILCTFSMSSFTYKTWVFCHFWE